MKSSKLLLATVLTLLALFIAPFARVQPARAACAPNNIIYVSPSGDDSDGCSWATAFNQLQDALAIDASGDKIWVAAGTYYPDEGSGQTNDSRDSTFTLTSGVSLYGGFNGTETLLAQRDPDTNITILSGDIGTLNTTSDNAYHVVSAAGIVSTTRLDGFTVEKGNADGPSNFGGGLYVSGAGTILLINDVVFTNNRGGNGAGIYGFEAAFTITNTTISNNTATIHGGGMYLNSNNSASNATLTDVTFSGNVVTTALTTVGYGGGMYNISGDPALTRVTFDNNTSARYGGGMYNRDGSPTLTDVTFNNNKTQQSASPGAGMHNYNSVSTFVDAAVLNRVTFSNNQSQLGGAGGMFNFRSNTIMNNVTFSGNSAYVRGGAMLNEGSNPILNNVTFTGNTAPVGTGGAMRNINASDASDAGPTPSNPVIKNTIFWDNGTEEIVNDVGGSIISATGVTSVDNGATITDTIVEGGCPSLASCTNVINSNPNLGTLADNGGETQTITVGASGAARNVGGVNLACASTDQRGVSRPQGSGCDIGSFEAKQLTVTPDAHTVPYGSPDPTFTFQYSGGFVDDDDSSDIDTPPTCSVVGAHTAIGSYTITCSSGVDDEYIFTYATNTFEVIKATPTLSITNTPVTYNSSPQTPTLSASTTGTFSNTLVGGSANQTNAGTYSVTTTFTPSDTDNYYTLTNVTVGDFVIDKATPVLSITNSPVTYDGSPQAASVTSSTAGSLSNILTGGAATQTTAGTYAVTASFTPNDTVNYNSLTNHSVGNFVINKATAVLTVTNSPVVFDGLPHAATVSSSVAGTVSNILTGGSATKTAVGTYAVTANFTPTDTTNYNTLTNASAGNFVITDDVTPPDTTLGSRPASPSPSTVSFVFTSNDPLATFECKLDSGSFTACTSPKQYTGLASGEHTFIVRAKDPAANVDATPPIHTWVVGTLAASNFKSKVLPVSSVTSQNGSASGILPNLSIYEQSDTEDTPSAYYNFQTPTSNAYRGYLSFFLASDMQASLVSSIVFQVNYKGPASTTQLWSFYAYDWTLDRWIPIGNTSIVDTPNVWKSLAFRMDLPRRFISTSSGEIRIQIRSNNTNGDAKFDYAGLHVTYRPTTLPVSTPSAPTTPTKRPGTTSTLLPARPE